MESKTEILMAVLILVSIWLIANWHADNWRYFFSPDNSVAGISLAIAYCLYRLNKVMYHKIVIINTLFIIIGIILIMIETPIFINSVEEIPSIRSSFYLADLYGLEYDLPYYNLKHTLLTGIFSLVCMIVGVRLVLGGSVRLLKSKIENH